MRPEDWCELPELMLKLTGANSLVAHMTPGFEPCLVTAEGAGILMVACLQGMFIDTFYQAYQMHLLYYRYFQQVLNETVRTAKLTPIAARLQENEGKVDQHIIPKEVSYSPLPYLVPLLSTSHCHSQQVLVDVK